MNWTEGTISSTDRRWSSVCYGNGKFVTVADSSNYFAYSTDGITWTEDTISDTSRNWYSVCYGNDKFVAVANSSNYFAYSIDIPVYDWVTAFSNTDISDYLKVSDIDPNSIHTDMYQYIDDKITQIVNANNNFTKHVNNELALIHITSDERSTYTAIINKDELINQIRTTTDLEVRVAMMHEAEDMLMDTWAVIPIYYYNDVYMQKENISGAYATVFGMKYFMYATKK